MASFRVGQLGFVLGSSLRNLPNLNQLLCPVTSALCLPQGTPQRHYAVRKGKRMELRKKHRIQKAEAVEKTFVPLKVLQAQKLLAKTKKKRSELGKKLKESPIDNVYCFRYYKWPMYSFEDAVKMHAETHHPTIYNEPNAIVNILLELDMKLQKKNRFMEKFKSLVLLPHKFEFAAPRKILAICKKPEEQEEALRAGANMTGGSELIAMIEAGDLASEEFHYVVATPDVLNELVKIRGLLKRKFPSRALGTLNFDVGPMVEKFANGIEYQGKNDELERAYGSVEVPIGRLQMPAKHLEENADALIKSVCTHRDLALGPFVTRAHIGSPPSAERFQVAHDHFLPAYTIDPSEKDFIDD